MSWIDRFPDLASLSGPEAADLATKSRLVHLAAGDEVFLPGQPARAWLLLLSGTVRVQQRSASGREVFLYRVHAGESCVLTTACLLSEESYAAEGVAETDVEAVALSKSAFDDITGASPRFRKFVFRAYSHRIAELFALIDDIVFQRMDVRLAGRLLDLAQGGVVVATHQALASELGTAREVVSRTLGEFQRRGWVEQARGELRLLNVEALIRLARSVT